MNTRDYSRLQSAFADPSEVAEADWWPERRRAFDTALARIAAGRSPLVVQGAAGVGKSAFLTRLLEAIEPLRETSLVSAADVPPMSTTADCAAGPPGSPDCSPDCSPGDPPHDSLDDLGDAPAVCALPGVLLVDDLHLAEEWWVRRMIAPCPDCPAPDVSHPRPLLVGTTERRALRSGLPGLGGEEDIGADNCIVLNPMTRTDVEAFVEARLIRAGYDGPPPFTEEAMDRIQFYSRGLPGRLTRLCRAALTAAAERGAWPVGEALVREVAWSLFLPESLKDRLPALGHSRPEASAAAVAGTSHAAASGTAKGAPPGSTVGAAHGGPSGGNAVSSGKASDAVISEPVAAPAGHRLRSAARPLVFAAIACFAIGIGLAVHVAPDGAAPLSPPEPLESETAAEIPPAAPRDTLAGVADRTKPEAAPEPAVTATEPLVEADAETAAETLAEEPADGETMLPEEIEMAAPADAPTSDAADERLSQEVPQEVPDDLWAVADQPAPAPASAPAELPDPVDDEVSEVQEQPESAPAVAAAPATPAAAVAPERKRRVPARTPRRTPSDRVAAAQAQLAQLGFSPGPVDGAVGPRTRRAIRAYQTRRGLAVTGAVDDQVMASLHRDTASQRPQSGSPSLLTSVIRTISATVGPRIDSVRDPGSVLRYCRNNPDTWVYDFGKERSVFCKYIDQPGG